MKLSAKEFEYQFRCLYRPLNMYALRYTENLDGRSLSEAHLFKT